MDSNSRRLLLSEIFRLSQSPEWGALIRFCHLLVDSARNELDNVEDVKQLHFARGKLKGFKVVLQALTHEIQHLPVVKDTEEDNNGDISKTRKPRTGHFYTA